jgi:hypothetical protein
MFDAAFDDSGTTGLFVDLRPFGVRYHVIDQIVIAFDPLSLVLVEPTFLGEGPSIRKVEYRTSLGVEVLLGAR